MPIQFEYYHSRESEQFTFYRIPKALFTEPAFRNLSTDAKLLYGLMLDRIGLSIRSGWVDEEDHVYIVYTLADIMDQLGCGHNKAVRLLKELDQDMGLIRRRKQGQGKPDRIYVMNFVSGVESQASEKGNSDRGNDNRVRKEEVLNSENGNSGFQTSDYGNPGPPDWGTPDIPKPERNDNDINKIYKNDTDPIYPINPVSEEDSGFDGSDRYDEQSAKDTLWDKWGLVALRDQYSSSQLEGLVALGADILTSRKPTARVGKQEIPIEQVRKRLLSLDFTHIDYVLECMDKTRKPIRNVRSYLLTALYNAPLTIDAYYTNLVALHEGMN